MVKKWKRGHDRNGYEAIKPDGQIVAIKVFVHGSRKDDRSMFEILKNNFTPCLTLSILTSLDATLSKPSQKSFILLAERSQLPKSRWG